RSETSAATKPWAPISAATVSSRTALRPRMVTVAPAAISREAIASPIPREPPVTRACRPCNGPFATRVTPEIASRIILSLKYLGRRRNTRAPGRSMVLKASATGGAVDEDRRDRRRTRGPLLRHPDEEGAARGADHRLRAQPRRRHVRLRRRVLRPVAGDVRGLRPTELQGDHRELRLLGRHRDPLQGRHPPHWRQRL